MFRTRTSLQEDDRSIFIQRIDLAFLIGCIFIIIALYFILLQQKSNMFRITIHANKVDKKGAVTRGGIVLHKPKYLELTSSEKLLPYTQECLDPTKKCIPVAIGKKAKDTIVSYLSVAYQSGAYFKVIHDGELSTLLSYDALMDFFKEADIPVERVEYIRAKKNGIKKGK